MYIYFYIICVCISRIHETRHEFMVGDLSFSLLLTLITHSAGFYLRCILQLISFFALESLWNFFTAIWNEFDFLSLLVFPCQLWRRRKSISRCRFPFFYWPIKLCRISLLSIWQVSQMQWLTSRRQACVREGGRKRFLTDKNCSNSISNFQPNIQWCLSHKLPLTTLAIFSYIRLTSKFSEEKSVDVKIECDFGSNWTKKIIIKLSFSKERERET